MNRTGRALYFPSGADLVVAAAGTMPPLPSCRPLFSPSPQRRLEHGPPRWRMLSEGAQCSPDFLPRLSKIADGERYYREALKKPGGYDHDGDLARCEIRCPLAGRSERAYGYGGPD